jgi:hypothetical protein
MPALTTDIDFDEDDLSDNDGYTGRNISHYGYKLYRQKPEE